MTVTTISGAVKYLIASQKMPMLDYRIHFNLGDKLPGFEIAKPIEDLGVKVARLSGASRLPGISWAVERHLRQETLNAQQRRLQPFVGRLVVVGGNFTDYDDQTTPDEIADRTSKILYEDNIIGEDRPVAIGTLIPDMSKTDKPVEKGADLIRTAVRRNYDISPYFIPEPQPMGTIGEASEPIWELTHKAIDMTIIGLREKAATATVATGHGEVPLHRHPRLVLMLVVRDSIASDAFPPAISQDDMKMGGTALLVEVGKTPQENVWLPESAAQPYD